MVDVSLSESLSRLHDMVAPYGDTGIVIEAEALQEVMNLLKACEDEAVVLEQLAAARRDNVVAFRPHLVALEGGRSC